MALILRRAGLGTRVRELAGSAVQGRPWQTVESCRVAGCACNPSVLFWGTSVCMAVASREHSCISFMNNHSGIQQGWMVRVFMILINKKSGRKTAPGLANLFNSVIKDPASFRLDCVGLSGSPGLKVAAIVPGFTCRQSCAEAKKKGGDTLFCLVSYLFY